MPAPTPDRCVLHLDADAFFASLEQRDDPKLRGRPVAVGTGVVASCSYEAKRHGVTTGMRLTEARQLCRALVVVPGEYRRYEQAARRVLAICEDHTPVVEMAALDDLYLDLTARTGPLADDGPARGIAAAIRAAVREEVSLSVSVGVGANKLVARVATREAKRLRVLDGGLWGDSAGRDPQSAIVTVAAGGERAYLAPWPARTLPGAGGQIGDKLERLNVHRVGEVADMPAPLLRGLFGGRGATLHEQSHGIDPRPVTPHRPQQAVGRRTSFDPPTADRAFLAAMLGYLIERACSWLRFERRVAKGLALTIRYGDYVTATGREPFRGGTDDEAQLREAAVERLDKLYKRRLPLRFLGVELTPLAPRQEGATLFPDPEEERRRRLLDVKDAVRRRFGFTSLLSGASLLVAGELDRDRENFKLRTPCLTR